jgi:hypothetical protein
MMMTKKRNVGLCYVQGGETKKKISSRAKGQDFRYLIPCVGVVLCFRIYYGFGLWHIAFAAALLVLEFI